MSDRGTSRSLSVCYRWLPAALAMAADRREQIAADCRDVGCERLVRARRVMIWHDTNWHRTTIYRPAVSTAVAGLRALGLGHDIAIGAGTKGPVEGPPFRGNLSALQAGDVFLWVGTPFYLQWNTTPFFNIWRSLARRRIWRIVYQTDPNQILFDRYLKGRATSGYVIAGRTPASASCALVGDKWRRSGSGKAIFSAEPPIDESWEYSWHNVEACTYPGRKARPRYVPIGLAGGALTGTEVSTHLRARARRGHAQRGRRRGQQQPTSALNVSDPVQAAGVRLYERTGHCAMRVSSRRQQQERRACFKAQRRPTSLQLLFLGDPTESPGRQACYNELKGSLPPAAIRWVYHAWSDAALERVMRKHVFFVNIHRTCGDAQSPLEGFRMAPLLRAGKVVLSERSCPRDEAEYRGLVTFADNMSHLAQEYLRLRSQYEDQAGPSWLELVERAADERATMFSRRFSEKQIWMRSGLIPFPRWAVSSENYGCGVVRDLRYGWCT